MLYYVHNVYSLDKRERAMNITFWGKKKTKKNKTTIYTLMRMKTCCCNRWHVLSRYIVLYSYFFHSATATFYYRLFAYYVISRNEIMEYKVPLSDVVHTSLSWYDFFENNSIFQIGTFSHERTTYIYHIHISFSRLDLCLLYTTCIWLVYVLTN